MFIASIIFISIIIATIAIRKNIPKIKGKIGEKSVAMVLSFLPKEEYTVLNDIIIKNKDKTSQIDHIVISPYGIFVIETKNYKGWIYGNTNSKYWIQNIWGNKYKLYNPIFQNNSHIKALKEALSEYDNLKYIPAIVFIRTNKIQLYGNNEYILWRSELIPYIKQFSQPIIDQETCRHIVAILSIKSINGREGLKLHIENVKNTITNNYSTQNKHICPICGGIMVKRSGQYGAFYGCSNYPKCKYTAK